MVNSYFQDYFNINCIVASYFAKDSNCKDYSKETSLDNHFETLVSIIIRDCNS